MFGQGVSTQNARMAVGLIEATRGFAACGVTLPGSHPPGVSMSKINARQRPVPWLCIVLSQLSGLVALKAWSKHVDRWKWMPSILERNWSHSV